MFDINNNYIVNVLVARAFSNRWHFQSLPTNSNSCKFQQLECSHKNFKYIAVIAQLIMCYRLKISWTESLGLSYKIADDFGKTSLLLPFSSDSNTTPPKETIDLKLLSEILFISYELQISVYFGSECKP